MSDRTFVAARVGVSASEIEILRITEERVSETLVTRTVHYRILYRGQRQLADNFLASSNVTDGRAIVAFYDSLRQRLPTFSQVSWFGEAELKAQADAMSQSLADVIAAKVPLYQPRWFSQLTWSPPVPLDKLPLLTPLPFRSGSYVFTIGNGMIIPGLNVLYVGVSNELRRRVHSYQKVVVNGTKTGHAGASLLQEKHRALEKVQQKLCVRWTYYAAYKDLEGDLIDYLLPHLNSRDEFGYHTDNDPLDMPPQLR